MSAAPYKGEDSDLFVGVESSQGTSVTPTRVMGIVESEVTPPDPEQEWLVSRIVGGDRSPFTKHQGQRSFEGGTVPVVLYDGAPLAYLLGSESFAADSPAVGTNTHTLTPKHDGKPPSQTLEVNYYGRGGGSDFTRTFSGCVPNSGTIEVDDESKLSVSLDYWAMGVTPGSTPTTGISTQSYDPWLFHEASSNLTLFGTAFARVQDFSSEVSNNLESGYYVEDSAGVDPFEILYRNLDLTLDTTIRVVDDSLYTRLVSNQTEFSAPMAFQRPNGDSITFNYTGCNIESAPHNLPEGSGPIDVEVSIVPNDIEVVVEDSNSTGAYLA